MKNTLTFYLIVYYHYANVERNSSYYKLFCKQSLYYYFCKLNHVYEHCENKIFYILQSQDTDRTSLLNSTNHRQVLMSRGVKLTNGTARQSVTSFSIVWFHWVEMTSFEARWRCFRRTTLNDGYNWKVWMWMASMRSRLPAKLVTV